ncbi:hypothetical protein AB205_0072340 [Aquarana catesbeiana]|uniref:Uncharacterized protein n=1 Tax=Aquarana catesbeiana TaxID=8400 RepID=A0A2G9QJZ2_AQUCT|nr:hypothetical protein AB205_0072340 [Aquarana catesbeiana]
MRLSVHCESSLRMEKTHTKYECCPQRPLGVCGTTYQNTELLKMTLISSIDCLIECMTTMNVLYKKLPLYPMLFSF